MCVRERAAFPEPSAEGKVGRGQPPEGLGHRENEVAPPEVIHSPMPVFRDLPLSPCTTHRAVFLLCPHPPHPHSTHGASVLLEAHVASRLNLQEPLEHRPPRLKAPQRLPLPVLISAGAPAAKVVLGQRESRPPWAPSPLLRRHTCPPGRPAAKAGRFVP